MVYVFFFLQLVLLVSMVTNARRSVNVNFLTWIKNVIIEMESVTASPDSPVNTVIKVCRIYYNQIRSYVTFQVYFLMFKGVFHGATHTQGIALVNFISLFLKQSKVS